VDARGGSSPGPWFFFDEAFEAMIVLRQPDDVIVEVNDAWCELTGYSRAEVIGRTPLEIGVWDEPEKHDQTMDDVIAGRFEGAEVRLRTRSGEIRLIEGRARIVEMDDVEYLVASARDITEIRDLLVLLEGVSREARQALVEALREGPIQPLAAAMMRIDVLERTVADAAVSNELAEIAGVLRTAMNRARALVRNLGPAPVSGTDQPTS
jgi:PAS domain S-box-containing protein